MTPSWRSREELVHQIVTLAHDGLSRRAITRAVGVSRNTVKAVLAAHQIGRTAEHAALRPHPVRAPRASKLDRFKPRIAELMTQYSDITAQRVFESLRAEGFNGGYNTVKKYVRSARPKPQPQPSLTTPEYSPGDMGESDWSPYAITFTDGQRMIVQALSYVLVHSTRKSFALFTSNDLHALMDGHAQAFERFKGCARQCKYDSQKPVVLRWEGSQPIYNPRFLAFSSHYEFRPVAVRRGHPNDKPRTERSFWEVERSFLNGRSFRDLADMRAQLAAWMNEVVDGRLRHKRSALDRFADERDHLVPLPRHPYDTARVIYRVCGIDGFIDWNGNRYAVPYDHVTDILPVRVTQRELFVYAADLRCIARHELARRGEGLKLDPAGLHPPPQRKSPLDLDQLHVAFQRMGENAAAFFRLMSLGAPRAWGREARQILLLRERYDTADIDRALGHAASFGALEHLAVERILAARSTPRTLDEYVAEDMARRLEETLGETRTQPRDLTEYDLLPLASASPTPTDCPIEETSPWPSETPRMNTTTPATDPRLPTPSSSRDCGVTSSSSD
jgi:transposase